MLVNISPIFLPHKIEFLKIFNTPRYSLVNLGFVGGERLDARGEAFIALYLDLVEGFAQDLVSGIHFADQCLDPVDRRLQG